MGIDVPFPAWPMRVGCAAGLDNDIGVKVTGNLEDVKYKVEMGAFKLNVDWENITGNGADLTKDQIDASKIFELVRGYVDFNGVLANITGKYVGNHSCYGGDEDEDTDAGVVKVLQQSYHARFESKVAAVDVEHGSASSAIVVDGTKMSGGGGSSSSSSQHRSDADPCPPCDSCPQCPASTRDSGANAKPRSCSASKTTIPPVFSTRGPLIWYPAPNTGGGEGGHPISVLSCSVASYLIHADMCNHDDVIVTL